MDTVELDPTTRSLLNRIQASFPVEERPYRALAETLGLSEEEVLSRIRSLREGRVIRQIGPIFDTKVLGYASSLVAARIPAERLEEGAAAISAHPGVSHNYRRDHPFNLWFTLAVAPDSRLGLERTAEILGRVARAEATRLLPTLRLYKIGVVLDMTGERKVEDTEIYDEARRAAADRLRPEERAVVAAVQEDLPAEPAPFEAAGARLGIPAAAVVEHLRDFRRRGILRRFAAILHHRRAGFLANAMAVWSVAGREEETDALGEVMASFPEVSHCYRRPLYPDWRWPLFTMIHGRSREECEAVVARIEARTGLTDHPALYSTKEYKKARLRYFTPEWAEWEARRAGEAP